MIKNGLMENNASKLELYLRKLFEIFDTEKTGRITPQHLMEAIAKADKIILSKMQLYILRNFVHKDAEGTINYRKESKFIAEMIQKFFAPSTLKKQVYNSLNLPITIGSTCRKRIHFTRTVYGKLDSRSYFAHDD